MPTGDTTPNDRRAPTAAPPPAARPGPAIALCLIGLALVGAALAASGLGPAATARAPEAAPLAPAPLAGGPAPGPVVVPRSAGEARLSFAPVVRAAAPAVVNVYAASRPEPGRHPLLDDPVFRELFGRGGERARQSVGSGVLVGADGTVVTNHHVIEGMSEVRVALADRREFEAEVVLRDPRSDLAVLRAKVAGAGAGQLPHLALGDADALEVGDLVLAIGNPFGVGQTVTQGIVSALSRTQVGAQESGLFIQTDAAINPGNSGGALVDMSGRLVGVNSSILSRSGGSHGIGFAVPANTVALVLASARAGAPVVRRPYLGASLQPVTADLAPTLGLDRPAGALVAAVREGTPAAAAGLKRGDVVLEVGGRPVADPEAFGYRFTAQGVGGEARLGVWRGGRRQELGVALAPAPEVPARDAQRPRAGSPLGGATVVNLSPAVAEELSLDATEGVVVAAVEPGSAAASVGFRKGDLVLAINGERVGSARDAERLTRARASYWRLAIGRDGQVVETVVGG